MNLPRIMTLLNATNVRRYHTVPIIGEQNLGHHSARVAMIILELDPSKTHLAQFALYHDLGEVITGDIPAKAKWNHPNLEEVLEEVEHQFFGELCINEPFDRYELELLTIADKLELILFATEQMQLGNSTMRVIRQRGSNYLRNYKFKFVGEDIISAMESFIERCRNECE